MPWSLPAAAGLVGGVVVSASLSASVAHVFAVVGVAAAVLALRRSRSRLAVTACLLALSVGVVRHEAWEARPDPVEPFLGAEVAWSGDYDGVWFEAHAPADVRFALVTGAPVPSGQLRVTGTARRAPGKRNPGGYDYRAYLSRRGVSAQLFVSDFHVIDRSIGLRERLAVNVAAGLPAAEAGLLVAMTLGLRDDISAEDRQAFSRSGLAHVLSLSGLHFGVLLAAAGRVLRPLGSHRRNALVVLTIAFVMLVGPAPSVVRSAAMTLSTLLALTTGIGRLEPWPVLALSACVSLLIQPQMLFDLSFQLSYLALAGLLLFTAPLSRLLGSGSAEPDLLVPELPLGARGGTLMRFRTYAAGAAAVSVASQLPSLSLVAGSFGSVPLLSPLVNLVGVPIAALAVPLGFLAGVLGLVWLPLAETINLATGLLARALIAVAEAGARLPALTWPEVEWLGHMCWAAFVCALALALRRRLRFRRLLLVSVTAAAVPFAVGGSARPPDVWFLDVGQGDATLIRLPGRYEVMIDGGGTPFSDYDVGARVVVPALRALGVDELEVVIATHPDADHVEGLMTVLRSLPVGTLVTGPPTPGVRLDDDLRALADSLGVPVHVAVRGETIVLGRSGDALFEVLHPPAGPPADPGNEASVVGLLRYREQPAALLLADVGEVTERALALSRVHVLKVGHHGSRFSTTAELLGATRPSVALISVGENRYGHPHPSVMERLQAHGVPVLTTQALGAVRFGLDGIKVNE